MLFGLTGPDDELKIKPFELFQKEITIKTSFVNPYAFERAVNLLARNIVDVSEIITDIIESDVACTTGQEDRKIVLFDDFNCFDFETGEVLGQPSIDKELINKLPKGY